MTEPKASYTLHGGIPRRFEVTVPGDPVPWERTGGSGKRRYKPKRTRKYQEQVGWYVRFAWKGDPIPKDVPLALTLRFFLKHLRLDADDWDNLGKSVSDAMEGIAFTNDGQFVDTYVSKRLDRDNPRVEILVEVL